MFTGIVKSIGEVVKVERSGCNKVFTISSELVPELKVDQSVSHNGVCLTVEKLNLSQNQYQITAIHETLTKTTLSSWQPGDNINLELAVTPNQRLDGHLVQGHVDEVISCLGKIDKDGSTLFSFELPKESRHLIIQHGSVTLDGISLTVAELTESDFSVAIIPYTINHTTAYVWDQGKYVNVEYDAFGKYMERYRQLYGGKKESS